MAKDATRIFPCGHWRNMTNGAGHWRPGWAASGNFGPRRLWFRSGVDAFEFDPISFFQLETEDFFDCGRRISGMRLPTVIVMEGGYAIDEIGLNVVGFLEGFLGS